MPSLRHQPVIQQPPGCRTYRRVRTLHGLDSAERAGAVLVRVPSRTGHVGSEAHAVEKVFTGAPRIALSDVLREVAPHSWLTVERMVTLALTDPAGTAVALYVPVPARRLLAVA